MWWRSWSAVVLMFRCFLFPLVFRFVTSDSLNSKHSTILQQTNGLCLFSVKLMNMWRLSATIVWKYMWIMISVIWCNVVMIIFRFFNYFPCSMSQLRAHGTMNELTYYGAEKKCSFRCACKVSFRTVIQCRKRVSCCLSMKN